MKRMISVVLVLTMIFGMVPVMTIPTNAFNIDKLTGSNYLNYLAANQARLLENTNIFAAQYYGQGTSEKTSADNRLRERASSMLYQHFAEIEAANTKKAVFSEVWAVVSVDTEKFSGLKKPICMPVCFGL